MACTCVCTCGYTDKRHEKKFWDEKTIISAISALVNAGFDVRYTPLMKANCLKASVVVFKAIGRKVSPKALYGATLRAKIPWRDAVEKAGYLNPRSKIKSRNFWNKSLVIHCIQELRREGHSLHTTGIRWDKSDEKSQLLRRVTGESITGHGLFVTGQKLFGNWRNCLAAAGINPRDVRLIRTKRAKDRYAHLPIQFESTKVNGAWKAVGLLGFAPLDPEEKITVSSQIAKIGPFLKKLREEDRALLSSVIATLLNDNEADDLDTAIQKTKFRTNIPKIERTKLLFRQLKMCLAWKRRFPRGPLFPFSRGSGARFFRFRSGPGRSGARLVAA